MAIFHFRKKNDTADIAVNQAEYRYFASVCSDQKDQRWARWLTRQMNRFHISQSLRKGNASLPEKLNPCVCQDVKEVSDFINLDHSRYLVVVCSENCKTSEHVNASIRRFRQMGKTDQIVLLLVSKDPVFPDALYDQGDVEVLAASVEELGKGNAFLRVMATMLGISFDQLVQRRKRRRNKRIAVASAAVVFAGALCGAGVWNTMPHRAYFYQTVYRNGVPFGIGQVSKEQRDGLYGSYCITTQRGKVTKLAYVNSQDVPVDQKEPLPETQGTVEEYYYNEEGSLAKCVIKNQKDEICLVKKYSDNGKLVELFSDEACENMRVLPADLLKEKTNQNRADRIAEENACINRIVLTYDQNGFVESERFYLDNRYTNACDRNGIYGLKFERNLNGQIACITYLGEGEAEITKDFFTYDERGLLQKKESDTLYGRSRPSYEIERDSIGNAVTAEKKSEVETDQFGHVILRTYYDQNHQKTDGADGYCTQKMEYDENGNVISVSFLDKDGEPAFTLDGYYYEKQSMYDTKHRVTQIRYLDKNGKPCRYDEQFTYDQNGNCISKAWYDQYGKLAVSSEQYAKIEMEYDDAGNQTAAFYFDEKGQLPQIGMISEKYQYDKNNLISVYTKTYGDEEGIKRTIIAENQYDDAGNLICVEYYDENHESLGSDENPDGVTAAASGENADNRMKIDAAYLDGGNENGHGVLQIKEIEMTSSAWKAGLRKGDVLVSARDWHYDTEETSSHAMSCREAYYEWNKISCMGGSVEVIRSEDGETYDVACISNLKDLKGVTMEMVQATEEDCDFICTILRADAQKKQETKYYIKNTKQEDLGTGLISDRENGAKAGVFGNTSLNRSEILSVTFTNDLTKVNDTVWDISVNLDQSVLAWVVPQGNLYHLFIGAEKQIKFNPDSEGMFAFFDHMQEIHFDGCVDTSSVTDCEHLFYKCKTLKSIDLSSFDTHNVFSTFAMFYYCEALEQIDLSGLDFGAVENANYMFFNCKNLKVLDFSDSNFSEENSRENMFGLTFLTGLEQEKKLDGIYRNEA